jgi:hypothetical protein
MGGVETWLMELLKYRRKAGEIQMDMLLTSGSQGIFDDKARKLGAQLFYVPYRRSDLRSFLKSSDEFYARVAL